MGQKSCFQRRRRFCKDSKYLICFEFTLLRFIKYDLDTCFKVSKKYMQPVTWFYYDMYYVHVVKWSGIACEMFILKSNINDLLLSFFCQEMAFCVSSIEIYSCPTFLHGSLGLESSYR